jgi:hypothetical protein
MRGRRRPGQGRSHGGAGQLADALQGRDLKRCGPGPGVTEARLDRLGRSGRAALETGLDRLRGPWDWAGRTDGLRSRGDPDEAGQLPGDAHLPYCPGAIWSTSTSPPRCFSACAMRRWARCRRQSGRRFSGRRTRTATRGLPSPLPPIIALQEHRPAHDRFYLRDLDGQERELS